MSYYYILVKRRGQVPQKYKCSKQHYQNTCHGFPVLLGFSAFYFQKVFFYRTPAYDITVVTLKSEDYTLFNELINCISAYIKHNFGLGS